MKKFYITTAIDYPSAPPHIGHAYEKICADAIARWHRQKGDDVFFSTGTDEHGQKIQRRALEANEKPQTYAERMSKKFIGLCEKLNISNDIFLRTTQSRHMEIVQEIFKKIYEKGDIYKGFYEGLYCVDCEAFYVEKDLKDGLCPTHNKKAEKIKEESFFFKMSKYQTKILQYFEDNKDFIKPDFRRNEVINRIKDGIRDLSVSRSNLDWAIPVPMDEKLAIFVWFDALVNYISALDYPAERFKKYWPADIHLIGKDILWFHAVVWPAILLAADIELPRQIFVHGFINIKGEKISKSKGETIDPIELADKYGQDALRYFLLREFSFGEDGDFSESALIKRANSDLANDIGNLLNRTLTMVEKYFSGLIPPGVASENSVLKSAAKDLPDNFNGFMQEYNFSEGLRIVFEFINIANKYIEDSKPWEMSKNNKKDSLAHFLYNLAESLRIIAIFLYPFIPNSAEKIWRQLGIEKDLSKIQFSEAKKWGLIKPGAKINKGSLLFLRIEV